MCLYTNTEIFSTMHLDQVIIININSSRIKFLVIKPLSTHHHQHTAIACLRELRQESHVIKKQCLTKHQPWPRKYQNGGWLQIMTSFKKMKDILQVEVIMDACIFDISPSLNTIFLTINFYLLSSPYFIRPLSSYWRCQ